MKKPSHSRIMLKCLETAFESKLSLARLADEELAALIRLQHSLWWHRIVASHLLSDYSDRSEELERKCRPAISQALRRLCADGCGERTALFAEALLPIPGHFPSFSKRIERLFAEYVEGSLREDSLPEARERALVAIYGLLRRFRASKKNPGYEYPIGRERAQAAIDKWMSSFDEQSGWEGLSAGTCLARLGCIEEYHVRHSLRISWEKRDAIFRRYLLDIGGYGDKDYCLAVALRGSSMDKAEDPFAEEDLAKACGLMLGSGDLATRLMAARAAVEALQAIHLEEASAMASIPETTRKRYLRAVKAGDPASMTDSELAKAAELACSVTNTLRSLEDECGFSAERLRISATARRLRAELAARGGDKMLRLARKMGLGGQMAAEPREDWAAGSREAVEGIVEKALSADAQGRSDAELSELAGLLKAIHDNRDRLEPDGERLERAMERCFAPL